MIRNKFHLLSLVIVLGVWIIICNADTNHNRNSYMMIVCLFAFILSHLLAVMLSSLTTQTDSTLHTATTRVPI